MRKKKKKKLILPVPVCQLHHDVKRGQAKDQVEEEVRVGYSTCFIVYNFLATKQGLVVSCEKKEKKKLAII